MAKEKQLELSLNDFRDLVLNDTDPNLAIERAHYRGQAYVCEKIKNDIKKAEKEFNKRSKKVR